MNKLSPFKWMLTASAILFFTACKQDEDVKVETENYKGIIVVNEGGFNKSNASVGIYKPGEKTYFDAFKKANDRPLGDVIQSMILIGDYYYIVVNNSNKIEVVNPNDFKAQAAISIGSPRYILPVSSGKAYVTNMSSKTLKVLNTSTRALETSIDIHHNSDHSALMDKKAFIATTDNKIMVLNSETDLLIDSIPAASGLSKLVNAGTDKLGVLCTGSVDWMTGSVIENGKILIINKDSNKIEKSYDLSSGSYGGSMVYAASTQSFYFSLGNNVIYTMTLAGVITEFKTLEVGRSVYSLTYNTNTGEIIVTDAGDFNSAGKVMVYDLTGTKTLEFNAGIAPNGVLFRN